MTVFEALYLSATFALLIVSLLSFIHATLHILCCESESVLNREARLVYLQTLLGIPDVLPSNEQKNKRSYWGVNMKYESWSSITLERFVSSLILEIKECILPRINDEKDFSKKSAIASMDSVLLLAD